MKNYGSISNGKDLVNKDYVDAHGGESLPVGTEVDFDGQASDIPTGWEEVDDPDSYSTTEKRIGTWVDGKPIYRKVFIINKADTSNSNINITHAISNLDLFVNVYGSIKRTDNIMNTVPNVNVSSTSYLVRIGDLDSSLIRVRLGEDIYNSMSILNIVAEYTKTTD